MTIDTAIRLTEVLLGFSFIQQSIEHLTSFSVERRLFLIKIILSLFLILGIQTAFVSFLLLLTSFSILIYFQGPYNGGADRMSLLILICLFFVHIAPSLKWQEMAFGYIALQLILSYFISGWVKIKNPQWRTGQALQDVFKFSAYPVTKSLRRLSEHPNILFLMSWFVMLLELFFPFSLLSETSLIVALLLTACFHFANFIFFGLNRFFWAWIAAYPSILWLQDRVFEMPY